MPRPERPLDPAAGPVQAFAVELRKLREQAGNPKYLQMARLSGRSRTALAEAAGGDHLPTWETTAAYVSACGADPAAWRSTWEQVQEQIRPQQDSTDHSAPDLTYSKRQGSSQAIPGPGHGTTATAPVETAGSADVLLRMWQEQRTQARQSENQRALMTVVISFISVWALTYYVLQRGSGAPAIFAALGLCALGGFGALVAAKYYERFKMHMDCAHVLRRRLDELFPELHLETDWANNRVQHQKNFSKLYKVRLDHLWLVVHFGIAMTGLILTILALLA